jgi:hypothetical protein
LVRILRLNSQKKEDEAMTRIIAVMFMLGHFQVAVDTSKGYFVATYPDTEAGVTKFVQEIRPVLETEPGRFYPCAGYDGPTQDLLQSPLAEKIGVALNLRTGLRDPGIADAPWIVRSDRIAAYRKSHPVEKLDAKLVEKMCVSLLPRNYMELYPERVVAKSFTDKGGSCWMLGAAESRAYSACAFA